MKKSILLLSLAAVGAAYANVTMPGVFSDKAVLQKSNATAVFGKADPGEKVSVSYAGVSASTVAGKDGKWLVRLDLSKSDDAGHDLVVKGKNTITCKDVITGEVWYCIGQSNMAMTVVRSMNAKENIAKSANNRIRHFRANCVAPEQPVDNIRGRWVCADPKTTGEFTAAGYFFARRINKECGVAVGLINPSWGGSSIESWISREKILKGSTKAVAKNAQKELDAYLQYDSRRDKYVEAVNAWAKEVGYTDDAKVEFPAADAKWTPVKNMQRSIKGNGIIWFRKTVNISKADYQWGKVLLEFGRPQVPVDVYLNGKLVAKLDMKTAACGRQFATFVPKLAPGKYEIMLRAYAYTRRISFPRYHNIGKTKNAQMNWEMFRQRNFAKLSAAQVKAMPKYVGTKPYPSKTPGMIWNGLVHPLIPYTMRGALWYQGEQNAGAQSVLYGDHVRALVSELRERFENPEFRFYAAQLPNFMKKSSDPNRVSNWMRVRAGQSSAIESMSGVAEAIIIDLGEANDIHPMNKEPVGERLAAIALRNDYGKKDLPCYSPKAVCAKLEGKAVKVTFKYADGGLAAKKLADFHWLVYSAQKKEKLVRNSPNAQVEGFALCGKDGKWFWADKADIKGDSVIVSSSKVTAPVAVRYAWQDNPTCNLYNGAGFPAAPCELKIK